MVVVDEHQRTDRRGRLGARRRRNHYQLKHVANHEARVVQHNLLHPDDLVASDHDVRAERGVHLPAGRQRRPHRAGRPREQGVEHVVGASDYGDTAYGWAMEDTTELRQAARRPATPG